MLLMVFTNQNYLLQGLTTVVYIYYNILLVLFVWTLVHFLTVNSNDTNGISNSQVILSLSEVGSTPKAKPNIGINSVVILGIILTFANTAKYITELSTTHTPPIIRPAISVLII